MCVFNSRLSTTEMAPTLGLAESLICLMRNWIVGPPETYGKSFIRYGMERKLDSLGGLSIRDKKRFIKVLLKTKIYIYSSCDTGRSYLLSATAGYRPSNLFGIRAGGLRKTLISISKIRYWKKSKFGKLGPG